MRTMERKVGDVAENADDDRNGDDDMKENLKYSRLIKMFELRYQASLRRKKKTQKDGAFKEEE